MYEIKENTIAIIPVNDHITKIIETEGETYSTYTNLEIIKSNCALYGSSYDGRKDFSENILKSNIKLPIIIDEKTDHIFFPTSSPRSILTCAWISLKHLKDYENFQGKMLLIFDNKYEVVLDNSFYSIENQILRSTRIDSIIRSRNDK